MQQHKAQHSSSPYSGQQNRAIKALSASEVEGLLNGRGMGLARVAELNHYPGPMHVLELAKDLGLTPAQKARVQTLRDSMHQAARIGRLIVAQEKKLEDLFAGGKASEGSVAAIVREIGRLQGENRLVHLRAHVRMKEILSAEQVAKYDALRGYHQQVG
jgi:Spy/CpxP family protein refolding chaperone